VAAVRLASSGTQLTVKMHNGACAVTVPELIDHEIVVFEFKKE
jgi:hypothetical protein